MHRFCGACDRLAPRDTVAAGWKLIKFDTHSEVLCTECQSPAPEETDHVPAPSLQA